MQPIVLADALEAVVGAVYLDRGFDAARRLVAALFARGLASRANQPLRDPKSELQERVQGLGGASPRYRLVSTTGPDHFRQFEAEVEALGRVLGRGVGKTKKAAEQEAARAALSSLPATE